MRKVNKILMATVSILLCLVLISTSVVSGIFAKFAINNKGSAIASLKAFGATLTMTVDETKLKKAGATVKTDEDKQNVTKSVTITGLKMAPGVELDKIINIELTGTPTVNCRFKLDIDLDFDKNKFIIPGGVFDEIGQSYMYFPVEFSFGRIDKDNNYKQYNYGCKDRHPSLGTDPLDAIYDTMVHSGIYFYDKGVYDDGNKYLYRDFPAGGRPDYGAQHRVQRPLRVCPGCADHVPDGSFRHQVGARHLPGR
jgi:hypothetical protein